MYGQRQGRKIVNIVGASKQIMEDVIFSYSEHFLIKTARFGNATFPNGSLPTAFLAGMEKVWPLSAPIHTKRHFVSSEKSGQI